MNKVYKKTVAAAAIVVVGVFFGGCEQREAPKPLAPEIELGTTIGSLAEVFAYNAVAVEGYGLVGGLNGTGSAQCPAAIKEYLEKYILTQVGDEHINVGKLISSSNTAVIRIRGIMPASASKREGFDVTVEALGSSQTTSLEHGWLYGTDLKPAGTFGVSIQPVGKAKGPVFIDTLQSPAPDKRKGYVLAGGTVLKEYKIMMALRHPDYKTANLIRNRLNARYGYETANALSDSQIELTVPAKYEGQRDRFIEMVKATYMQDRAKVTEVRIMNFVRNLAVEGRKQESEIALEMIGNQSVPKLSALLKSSNEEVRLRAARCMLNMGNDAGLDALRQIAFDTTSPYRIEALHAIAVGAGYNDSTRILRRLLRDNSFEIRLAAYERLSKLDDISIAREMIAESFSVEQIAQSNKKVIFAARSGEPRIVLFGAPIYCQYDTFVESAEGDIILNAPLGQNFVSVVRKHPRRPEVIIKLKSSFELSDIIRTLANEPVRKTDRQRIGLGASYGDVIEILQKMCEKGVIPAEFKAGPLPKIGAYLKPKALIDR